MTIYSKIKLTSCSGDTQTCSICMEDFKGDDSVVVTACQHIFHKMCREGWRKMPSGDFCPLCKTRDFKLLSLEEVKNLKYVCFDNDWIFLGAVFNAQKLAPILKNQTDLTEEESIHLSEEVTKALGVLPFDSLLDKDALWRQVHQGFLEFQKNYERVALTDKIEDVLDQYVDEMYQELLCKMLKDLYRAVLKPRKKAILTCALSAILIGITYNEVKKSLF